MYPHSNPRSFGLTVLWYSSRLNLPGWRMGSFGFPAQRNVTALTSLPLPSSSRTRQSQASYAAVSNFCRRRACSKSVASQRRPVITSLSCSSMSAPEIWTSLEGHFLAFRTEFVRSATRPSPDSLPSWPGRSHAGMSTGYSPFHIFILKPRTLASFISGGYSEVRRRTTRDKMSWSIKDP